MNCAKLWRNCNLPLEIDMSRTWNYNMKDCPTNIKVMLLHANGEISYDYMSKAWAGTIRAWASAGAGVSNKDKTEDVLERIERRLARIESRNVQMMYHLGMDAHERRYDSPNQHAEATDKCASGDKDS